MSSSSSGSLRRRQTIACQQINVLDFCSTPVIEKNVRPTTISVSTIDTNSSSSRKRQGKNQSELKRKVLRKRISKDRKNLKHKREQERKKRKETRRSFAKIDIDKDWETCNEYSPVKNVTSDSDKCVLFKDLSPEKTREAPNFIEDRLKSPILQSRTLWQIDSPKRISFEEKEKAWPLEDLSFSTALHLNDDDEEEEHTLNTLSLRRENVVKTYPGCRKRERRNNISVKKCKQWFLKTSFPTVASNFLWDKFVKENYDKVGKYLTHPDNDEYNMSLRKHCRGRKNDNDKNRNSEKQEENFKFTKKLKLPKNIVTVRGCWNKSLEKWDRDESIYGYPHSEDCESEENDRMKNMSLNEFLQKCRTQKKRQSLLQKKKQGKKTILPRSSSSSPTHQESVEKNNKSSISNLRKQKKRQRSFCQNVKSEAQTLKSTMSGTSHSKLARINTMISHQNVTSDQVVSSLKRKNREETDDKDNNCKNQKLKKYKKPMIQLEQQLTGIKLNKCDKNWKIVKRV